MNDDDAKLEIEAAGADDAVAIHALIRELAHDTGLADKFCATADDYRRFGGGDDPLFEALVARENGAIVGVALYFYTFSTWRGEPGVYLQDLVVTKAARGRLIGERLMRHLVRAASGNGATHLRLAVDRNNHDAARFYERCGLTKTETDFIYGIDGEAFGRMQDSS